MDLFNKPKVIKPVIKNEVLPNEESEPIELTSVKNDLESSLNELKQMNINISNESTEQYFE